MQRNTQVWGTVVRPEMQRTGKENKIFGVRKYRIFRQRGRVST
jgi:hypothetical protein